jgi:hypothetical protein
MASEMEDVEKFVRDVTVVFTSKSKWYFAHSDDVPV